MSTTYAYAIAFCILIYVGGGEIEMISKFAARWLWVIKLFLSLCERDSTNIYFWEDFIAMFLCLAGNI